MAALETWDGEVWYSFLDLPLSMGEKAACERLKGLLLMCGQGHLQASVDQTVFSQILEDRRISEPRK